MKIGVCEKCGPFILRKSRKDYRRQCPTCHSIKLTYIYISPRQLAGLVKGIQIIPKASYWNPPKPAPTPPPKVPKPQSTISKPVPTKSPAGSAQPSNPSPERPYYKPGPKPWTMQCKARELIEKCRDRLRGREAAYNRGDLVEFEVEKEIRQFTESGAIPSNLKQFKDRILLELLEMYAKGELWPTPPAQ